MVSSTTTDGAAKVYTCPTCARQFNKKANLKVHSRKHTGEKPYACSRQGCDRRFMWKSSVSFHEQNCVAGAPGAASADRAAASSVPKRHKMMLSSTASPSNISAMGAVNGMSHMPMSAVHSMGHQQHHAIANDATTSLLSIIPNTVHLESSPPRPHVTNVVQMPVDYSMPHQQQQHAAPDFLRPPIQSNHALAQHQQQQQQYLFQQHQQQHHQQQQQAMSMTMSGASRQTQTNNGIGSNPFSMLPGTFPPGNGISSLRNPLMDGGAIMNNTINNNTNNSNINNHSNMSPVTSSASVGGGANNNNVTGNMGGSVSSAMFSHITQLDSGGINSGRGAAPLPPTFPSEANPLPAPSTILESKTPASLPSANRPPIFLGKSPAGDGNSNNINISGAKPPKGMKMPIAMELDDSDDEDCNATINTAGIIGAQETFMRTGNIFTFAPPPRCSPLPASSPIVGHGISAMPLSPLAPFSPLPPDSPAHNAPNPVHPPLNQPPRHANTNF